MREASALFTLAESARGLVPGDQMVLIAHLEPGALAGDLALGRLGLALSRDHDGRQHAAAERFRQARAGASGAPLAVRGDGPAASEDRLLRLERRYNALAALLTEDQHMAQAEVALDLRPPWLHRSC